MSRRDELLDYADTVKGFMPRDEGLALFEFALAHGERSHRGTWLEIGAWCGKSAVYLGAAAEATNSVLYSLDHHHGSEENQTGWEHFDAALIDPSDGRLNTLPSWQRTISDAQLEFNQPLDILFIDGGHGHDVAWADYEAWTPKIVVGGLLLIHDVFANLEDGGRPPYEIYCAALESGAFIERAERGSLRALTRIH